MQQTALADLPLAAARLNFVKGLALVLPLDVVTQARTPLLKHLPSATKWVRLVHQAMF